MSATPGTPPPGTPPSSPSPSPSPSPGSPSSSAPSTPTSSTDAPSSTASPTDPAPTDPPTITDPTTPATTPKPTTPTTPPPDPTTAPAPPTTASPTTAPAPAPPPPSTTDAPPPPKTTSSPPKTASTPITSVASNTITSMSNGRTITITYASTTVIAPGNTIGQSQPTSSTSSNSHVGAIVGGALGGVTALAFIVVLVYFCLRRRRYAEDDFDGNFDPDRVGPGKAPHIDLAEETAEATRVTPFQYHSPSPSGDDASMRQYHDAGHAGIGVAGGMHSPPQSPPPGSRYSSDQSGAYLNPGYVSPNGHYGPGGQGGGLHPGVGPGGFVVPSQPQGQGQEQNNGFNRGTSPPPTSVSNYSTSSQSGPYGGLVSSRSAKEREAMGRYAEGVQPGGLALATPMEGGAEGHGQGPPSGSMVERTSSTVVVHQDGGRVDTSSPHAEPEQPTEIPPTYDSIAR